MPPYPFALSRRRPRWPAILPFVSLLAALLLGAPPAWCGELDYGLIPLRVAPDTYMFLGEQTGFTARNGGNMVNTGFIVTEVGVAVIDTGLTRLYALQVIEAIGKITDQPIVQVINTHFHPDHTFGNIAYAEIGIPILAPAAAIAQLKAEGPELVENIAELIGPWAEGTRLALPERSISGDTVINVGGHALRLILFGPAHTKADLAVLDTTTGVLFASDLVFHESAPATPNADLTGWVGALRRIEALPYSVLVPGHGPAIRGKGGLEPLRAYLEWLPQVIDSAIMRGDDINGLLARPIPAPHNRLLGVKWQFQRSVLKFFPEREDIFFGES